MAELTHPDVTSNKYLTLSLERPVAVMLAIFVLASLVKIVDTFFLPINELVGELIITKVIGFLMVVAWVWLCGRKLADIGFHTRALLPALLIPIVCAGSLSLIPHLVQLLVLRADSERVELVFSAIDPKTGLSGGLWFGLWLVIANLVNSAMEEGLFRGLMIRHYLVRYRILGAMVLQTILFAVWHLNWPVQHLISGESTLGEATYEAAALLVSTSIAAVFYGVLYYKTDNLWAPFVGHFINNSIFNVLFFRTAEGLQSGLEFGLFLAIWLGGYLLLIPIIVWLANRYKLPNVMPWGQFEDEAEAATVRSGASA